MSPAPYLTYSHYLRQRHGCAVYRVAVDAGFTCPNRGEDRTRGGCSYCDPAGSRAPYLSRGEPARLAPCAGFEREPIDAASLERQVRESIDFYTRTHRGGAFILYFQAYSNTNAPPPVLRRVYDAGLALADFRGLNVATRPDCIDEEKADLLASYRGRGLEVWAELGLQSASDETLRRVGRGHTFTEFTRAFRILRERAVKISVHLIFGLPGEGKAEIERTMGAVAALRPDGVKIHNLHVPRETPLARDFQKGELTAPSAPRHLEYVISAIEMLPPWTVIMRLTCDTPAESLAAPRDFWPKERFLSELEQVMNERGARQGRRYEAELEPAARWTCARARTIGPLDRPAVVAYSIAREKRVQVKDPDIYRIAEKIGDHFQNNVSNRFTRKVLLTLELRQSEWDRLENLTDKSDYYKQQGFTLDELYEMVLAAAHFIHESRQKILPNIRGMLAVGSTEQDRVLRDMAAQNFGVNLKILSDLINELYMKTMSLDKAMHDKKQRPVYEHIPELKDLGKMLVNES